MDSSELASVEGLIRSRQKILAIKRLRELNGQGLKEAKDAVEHFATHGTWRPADVPGLATGGTVAAPVPAGTQLSGDGAAAEASPLDEITGLVRSGRKIDAIKRYRELTGLGLKEAKDAVDALTSGRPVPALVPSRPEPTQPRSLAAAPPAAQTVAAHLVPAHLVAGHLVASGAASPAGDPEAERALRALVQRFPDDANPLAVVRAECGLFRGHLFVTDRRVAFVADRYGNLEVTEAFERKELEKIEARHDAFGDELVLEAGFHSARFSGLDEATTKRLAAYLEGKLQALGPPTTGASAPAVPHVVVPTSPSGPLAMQPAFGGPVTEAAAAPPFSFPKLLFTALAAGLPLALYGSAWRVIPMEDFPAIANSVLYWTALSLGAAVRGRAGAMLGTGIAVGALAWLATTFTALHGQGMFLALVLLGGAYGRALEPKAALLHAFLAVPVHVLNTASFALLAPIATLPWLGFCFWFVHFAVEDARKRRAAQQPGLATPGR